MREGLRSSSNLSAKSVKNEVTAGEARKEANDNKQKECGSNDEENLALVCSEAVDEAIVSTWEEEMQVAQGDGMKCDECVVGSDDCDVKAEEGSADCRKRCRIDGEKDNEDAGVEKKVAKEEVVVGKVQVFSRVLRSRIVMKTEGGREYEGRKSVDATGGSDESAKKRLAGEEGEGECDDIQDGEIADDGPRQILKCKRGRPPKVRKSDESGVHKVKLEKEDDACVDGEDNDNTDRKVVKKFKGKHGHPSKARESGEVNKMKIQVKVEEEVVFVGETSHNIDVKVKDKFKRKRGRPLKAQKSDGVDGSRVDVGSAGKESHGTVKAKVGRPPKAKEGEGMGRRKRKASHNVRYGSSLCAKTFNQRESKAKKLAPGKKIKPSADNEEQDIEEPGERRQSIRQVVRQKIEKLLLDAGWTIEHRPRLDRDYTASVYVNPEGRTHWSVTLAYRVLKKHYDDGGANACTCKAGFTFTPIPDEEINVLTKVMVKERCDKNKKRKKWKQDEQAVEKKLAGVGTKKKQKEKQCKRKLAKPASTKALRGRTRAKTSFIKQDDLVNQSDMRTAASARSRKWLKTHDRKRCALMVRNSELCTESDGDGYVLYNGKRSVLAWMIDLGTVPENGKVCYLKHRTARTMFEGTITADGIQCNCCEKILSMSEFESHAGGKSCQPSTNIYLERGNSLLQCQLDSWNKQDVRIRKGFHYVDISGEDPNDDTCGICGDGGNLICCDGCPSTFHQSCLDIKNFPSGVWHCLYCSCKFCGMVDVVASPMGDNDDDYVAPTLLTCCSCQEKYHESCVQIGDVTTDNPSCLSFCGKKCHELHKRLQKLLGVRHELQDGFSWTLLRRCNVGSDISVRGMPQKVKCNSKVAVALHVMDECFLPMSDHRSGVNLIHNIVYNFGSNLNRLNYSGFLTAILEKGDEIVAAASIRIHGTHLAEIPFIGTRYVYRRQGMCRRLLSAIETGLSSLNVEKLVIPAISELRETWTSVFGFELVEGLSKQRMRSISMVVFPGVDMLQKPLLKHQLAEGSMVSVEGLHSSKLNEQQTRDETLDELDHRYLNENNLRGSKITVVHDACNLNGETAADECGSPVLSSYLDESAICEDPNVPLRPTEDNMVSVEGLLSLKLKEQQSRNDIVDDSSDHRCSTKNNLRGPEQNGLRNACYVNGETAADECAPHVLGGCLDELSTCANPNVTVWLAVDNTASIEGLNSSELKEQQTKNKITDDSSQRCSNVCNMRVSEKAGLHNDRNISGETAADECASSIPNGCINEASANACAGPNLTVCPTDAECLDASVAIPEGITENYVNILNSCVDKQAGEISKFRNQSFGSAITLSGQMMPDLEQHKLYQKVESKASEISGIGSEASNCRREFLSASKELIGTLHLGVEPDDKDAENKHNSPATAPDLFRKSNLHSSKINGQWEASEAALGCCASNRDCQCDRNKRPSAAQPDVLLDKRLIPDMLQVNTESSKHPGFDSHVDLTSMTQSNSESLSNSNSTHGIPLHCASGGGSSCGAPDIMILSNLAS